ncbi:hypothetical protein [Moheibacter sp.]|uniref:hypothetical protein n=1 Tax=Moheibacter sp. TaxID=1965316 RepID=UPI003C721B2D
MKKAIYLLVMSHIIMACSSSNSTETELKMTSNSISSCLESKNYKYETLLTKADLEKYVNIDESSFKQEISTTKGKYGSCVYSWKSDRPDKEIVSKVTGATFKRPDMNQVTIKMLDFYTDEDLSTHKQETAVDLFDRGYKKLSQTEYEELLANFEKELGEKPKELAQAKKILESRMKFEYKAVDNLGDRAYQKWTDYGIELVVLTGNARFTILNKTSESPETSLNDAVNFAREVLEKCRD